MHESSVTGRILSIAQEQALRQGHPAAKVVRVRIGAWACIEPNSLRQGFEEELREHGFPHAELEIELVKPECRCEECGAAFEPEQFTTRCDKCGSLRVVMREQPEMEVVAVEV